MTLDLIFGSNTSLYILQPFPSPRATPGRTDPVTDVNLLRWHIFKGGWEEETTAHNCPFQLLACTSTAHSCCVIDAHSPTCQQLQSVPCFWRKCFVPVYLVVFAYVRRGQTFNKQRISFFRPLSTHNTWETMYLELCFWNFFLHLYSARIWLFMSPHYNFIFFQILIDTFLISVCQRSISLFC